MFFNPSFKPGKTGLHTDVVFDVFNRSSLPDGTWPVNLNGIYCRRSFYTELEICRNPRGADYQITRNKS